MHHQRHGPLPRWHRDFIMAPSILRSALRAPRSALHPGDPRMRLRPAALTLLAALLVAPAVRANSSNSLMDVSADGSLLLVANRDNGTVSVVDAVARKKLHEIKV